MGSPKNIHVGLAGGALVLLVYPVTKVSYLIAGAAQGCSNKQPALSFCGIQGELAVPFILFLLAWVVLRIMAVRRWLVVVAPSFVALLVLYLLYTWYSFSLSVPGIVVFAVFALIGGLFFSYMYQISLKDKQR